LSGGIFSNQLSPRLAVTDLGATDPITRLARRARGTALFLLGRFADAAATLNEGIAIVDALAAWEDPAHLLPYTERAGVVCRLYAAWNLWFLGFPDRAMEVVETGLALGQRLAHAKSLAFAQNYAALLQSFRREFAAAQTGAEAAIDIASKYGLPHWLAEATMCRGFALVGLGQEREGLAQLRTGLADWNSGGSHVLDTQWLGFIAEAHLRAGEYDDALTALDRAAEICVATGACHCTIARRRKSSYLK
jgi:tetratricopeptide (TPR) repeat protein